MDTGGGEEFVAFLFADNYFELYVNGELLAIDPVPFTPFNSNVIRFTADRPATIAVMMVDWEENLGLHHQPRELKLLYSLHKMVMLSAVL